MSPQQRARSRSNGRGIGVDASGGPVIDPTENVKALSEAANARQDDLRAAQDKLLNEKVRHLEEIARLRSHHNDAISKLREEYQEKISRAEASRLDSIRQVDREEVAKTAVAANTAITTLAKQTNDLAVSLAKTVTDTAAAAESRNSGQYSDTNKRLSALELASSERQGKQTVSDPQMEKLTALVETLARNQVAGSGQQSGASDTWKMIALGISMLVGLIGIGTFVFVTSRAPAPNSSPAPIIYTPAPPGTQLPSAPPASAPR